MALPFIRLEYVQRSKGQNACAKAAYNSRGEIQFHGTRFAEAKNYDFSHKDPTVHSEVMLPEGACESFKDKEKLWNHVEQKEKRGDSQIQQEFVLALPDDKEISKEDYIKLLRQFTKEQFTDKGFAVQIDIHMPEEKLVYDKNLKQLVVKKHNWHAHGLATMRRFKEGGLELEDKKPRHLFPVVRNGFVVSGPNLQKIWTDIQNNFFKMLGLDLRVDPIGINPQEHMGPVRMRGRNFDFLAENERRSKLNEQDSQDPEKVLAHIVKYQSTFSEDDLNRFLQKHCPSERIGFVARRFWAQEGIIELHNPDHNRVTKGNSEGDSTSITNSKTPTGTATSTREETKFYTTKEVIAEERKIERLADALARTNKITVNETEIDLKITKLLTAEQKKAFSGVISDPHISCIQGFAGTGKSYLLAALKDAYESKGYTVRGLGPDNATAQVLKEKGFVDARNTHNFLFCEHHGRISIDSKKEVLIVDEASKIGNGPLLELVKLADKYKVKLIFSGDNSQMGSVSRGAMFPTFLAKYGSHTLVDIQRQKSEEQRAISLNLAMGEVGPAIDQINKEKGIHWSATKAEAMEALISKWAVDRSEHPTDSQTIMASTNSECAILNEMARDVLKEDGEILEEEFEVKGFHSTHRVSTGDQIEFRVNDTKLNVKNGEKGTLVSASEFEFLVDIKGNKGGRRSVSFEPDFFSGYQLGYAKTIYRNQGGTFSRAYVCHSEISNQKAFYVAGTRHKMRADIFVSKDETYCFSQFKCQVASAGTKRSIAKLMTREEMDAAQKKEMRGQHIDSLIGASSPVKKVQGYGLSLIGRAKDWVEARVDTRPDEKFFNPSDISKEEENPATSKAISLPLNSKESQPLSPEMEEQEMEQRIEEAMDLSEEDSAMLRAYYNQSFKVSTLNKEGNLQKLIGSSDEKCLTWLRACGTRNRVAAQLMEKLSQNEIDYYLTGSALEQGKRYIENKESRKSVPVTSKEEEVSKLPEGKLRIFEAYRRVGSEATFTKALVDVEEAEAGTASSSPFWKECMQKYGKRNELAHLLVKSLTDVEKKEIPQWTFDHAKKYKETLAKFEEHWKESLKNKVELTPEKMNLLCAYREKCRGVGSLRSLFEVDKNLMGSGNKEEPFKDNDSPYFKQWLKGTGNRNELAFLINKQFTKEEVESHRDSWMLDYGDRHKKSLVDDIRNDESPYTPPSSSKSTTKLSENNSELLSEYKEASKKTAALREVAQSTAEGEEVDKSSPHYLAWMQSCGPRNALASQMVKAFSEEERGQYLSPGTRDQATRYDAQQEQRKELKRENVHESLVNNLEPLLFRLFPDGPAMKSGNNYRYGAKGSLSINVAGEKKGIFYDFENQEAGGPLKLIQKELGMDKRCADSWARDFLGIASRTVVPKAYSLPLGAVSKDMEWISLKPDPRSPAPMLQNIPGSKLHYFNSEGARHTYRDEHGEPLFHVLRLLKKDGLGKLTMPLSYGHPVGKEYQHQWKIKHYSSGKSPLYNLDQIYARPKDRILVVEGEKAADAVSGISSLKEMVAVSWVKGASAVAKSDWSPLAGREVWIWPDNDKAGFKAGDNIVSELKRAGAKSVHLISKDQLKEFPEKWDVADAPPSGVSIHDMYRMLHFSPEKWQGSLALASLTNDGGKDIEAAKMDANQIFFRVDERLRPGLESDLGASNSKVYKAVLEESLQIFDKEKALSENISQRHDISGEELRTLTRQCLLYSARFGEEPNANLTSVIYNSIKGVGVSSEGFNEQERSAFDASLTNELESKSYGQHGQKLDTESLKSNQNDLSQQMMKQLDQQLSIDALSQQKSHSRGQELSL